MFGKALKATLGAGIGCLVLIIGLAVIGGLASTTGKPTGTLTPGVAAPATTATSSSAIAAEKQWVLVKSWSGDGAKTTEQFTVGAEWRLDWVNDGSYLGVTVYDVRSDLPIELAANTTQKGSDSTFLHKAGTYYLKVNAIGPWKIAVQDRR